MKISRRLACAALVGAAMSVSSARGAEEMYLEPGTVRLSHELTLEGLLHRTVDGYQVADDGVNKVYAKTGSGNGPTRAEFGEGLLTEAAVRFTPGSFARILFQLQGDYADRFWRPVNEEHRADLQDRHGFVREAEAKLDRENWYLNAFDGVGHGGWYAQGDFFELYPASLPDDDYLGHSTIFGIYPDRFKQSLFQNISDRRVPKGLEGGGQFAGFDGAVAYGDELAWGLEPSVFARLTRPIETSKVTVVYRDERLPSTLTLNDNENHNRAGALSWDWQSDEGQRWQAGVLYNPYRTGENYTVANPVPAGTGVLGSSWELKTKKSKDSDGLAERFKMDRHAVIMGHDYNWMLDLLHADILAGNKEQLDARLSTDFISTIRGMFHYTYRRPIEGPVPLLYEGTPSNMGNIVASPRGPESPFNVNWSNREAVFVVTTIAFDLTPNTNQMIYDPEVLEAWNINKGEDAPLAFAIQHRMSDYRTSTDRQAFINQNGDVQFDSPAHSGAWASDGFLHEFRVLVHGHPRPWGWVFGVAGGQSLAISNVAYSNNAAVNKPISEYYALEGRLDRWPFAVWGHFGSGVWAPEPFQYYYGETFDKLWGAGGTYNLTTNTSVDVSYLAARLHDGLFVAPDVGAYDEWRMIFTHRFGFLFEFSEPARAGYRAH
ncbi:MAG: hypothetical protein JO102_02575 [Elusimicrobia bacterium]|nr:hypothetical protein [Elusimicrobiota bacterium]